MGMDRDTLTRYTNASVAVVSFTLRDCREFLQILDEKDAEIATLKRRLAAPVDTCDEQIADIRRIASALQERIAILSDDLDRRR